ncbi:MAG TPA: DUF5671 domain-containing protein [Candidatus Dormibacteraeota bacterium]|nr:DUF5671 domain-containing protein [Candidatus Dormibacteraeota bacterium]
MILRRLYLYIVSAASLAVLAFGLGMLGTTALLFAFNDPFAQQSRSSLATATAMVLVAGLVWAIHFWFARHYAMRDASERASALRHLYLYAACFGGAVGAAIALNIAAGDALRPLIDNCSVSGGPPTPAAYCRANANWESTSQAAWVGLVLLAVWAFHFWVAARDRAAVGEMGTSATLRRWYMYGAVLIGLLMLLSGLQQTIEVGWQKYVGSSRGDFRFAGETIGLALGGFLLWGVHARTIARHHLAEDRHSTLRALQGFIAVAVSMVASLVALSTILYYALARALGVESPGGVNPNDLSGALATPTSQLIVYGIAWVLVMRRLTRDAGTQEADRQAAIRRLYTNLASLVALAAWAAGAAVLLGTLAEQLEAQVIGARASDWKDPSSLAATLMVVGLAVWLAYWRQAPWAADRQSLSRRLYVWAALLGSVLAALGGGVALLTVVLLEAFSVQPRLNDPANLQFASALAVIVVAAGVGIYHWRVLRGDAAARPPRTAPTVEAPAPTSRAAVAEPVPTAAPVVAGAPSPDAHAHQYMLVVSDATEDDIHQALATLPPHASYKLTSNGHDGQ